MKIYWLTMGGIGCFLLPTREEAEYQRDFRIEHKSDTIFGNNDWGVQEEEIPDEEIGYCINGFPWQESPAFVLARSNDCSVGMVRKSRNNVSEDDGKCNTCPYFRKTIEGEPGKIIKHT